MQLPELDDLYREVVLDHYRSPRGRAPLEHADVHNEGFNPVCGDEVRVALCFDAGRVAGVEVQGRGCSISVASGSMLAERLAGLAAAEVEGLAAAFKALMHGEPVPDGVDLGDLEALSGVRRFPVRIKCALLAWTTLEDALRAWQRGQAEPGRSSTTEDEGERS